MYALELRKGFYAVRPTGKLGTCGWFTDGTAWTVVYVEAGSEEEALCRVRNCEPPVKKAGN